MSVEYKTGDVLEARIEKIVPRGLGLAFADNLTVFVPLAVAGDVLSVRIRELKGKTAFAEIESVIEPSSHRISAPCVYFGTCGGCDFQQMSYAAQLTAKVGIIRDNLHRIGKIEYENEIPIIPSPAEFGYRLRAQWHVEPPSKKIGYYRRNSRDLVDIERCIILTPELQNKLTELRSSLRWEEFTSHKIQIDAVTGDDGETSVSSRDLTERESEIEFSALGEKFRLSARSFFQSNRFLIEKLIETAIGGASGGNALDLYCGVGLFTLPLARRFSEVIGVEENEEAVRFGRKSAADAGLTNLEFRSENVRRYLANVVESDLDLVLLDPPRFGTEKEMIASLIRIRPRHISYVSCDPSVLARDLRRFVENEYAITSITALDMFPQTHHVETVVHLDRE
ncbi:MAG TPA: class I SAM-dependent RNA methyltransferase [Pyrinomonadaceae bacterium]|nr:class I SAM-dependent RNA methyltransferase [Pyrinomonadaceae bacterium]